MPQNDTLLPVALGGTYNHPPRVAEELMPVSRFVTANVGCPTKQSLAFNTFVEEPDLGDTTHYRWYIDWNPTTNPKPFQAGAVNGNGLSTLRNIPPLPVSLDASSTNPLATTLGTHTVELWVTDGEADDTDTRRPAPPVPVPNTDGGVNPFYVATFAWVVNTVQGCTP